MFAKKNKIIYSKRRLDTRIYCQSAKGSSKRCFGRPFAAKARIESNTFQPPKTQIYLWIFTQMLSQGWCVRKSKLHWYSTLVNTVLKWPQWSSEITDAVISKFWWNLVGFYAFWFFMKIYGPRLVFKTPNLSCMRLEKCSTNSYFFIFV